MAAITAVPCPSMSTYPPSSISPSGLIQTPPEMRPMCGCRSCTPVSITAMRTPRPVLPGNGSGKSSSGFGGDGNVMRYFRLAVFDRDHEIGDLRQRRAMRDHNKGAIAQQTPQIGRDQLFGFRIEG